jgi:transposase
MELDALLLGETDLQIDHVAIDADDITITVTSVQDQPGCPKCSQPSGRVHSTYVRTVADVTWAALSAHWQLRVRRMFCDNPDCPRQTFAERLGCLLPGARRSVRLTQAQQAIALARGGEAGARLSAKLRIQVSPDTLLRMIRCAPSCGFDTPRVLGVDDWAYCRGTSYGTLLVDLERHVPIDVLADRTAETFANWLKEHPGIEIISRDRAGAYAEGAATGAPTALQVADRWHLLNNLRETLVRCLDRHHREVQRITVVANSVSTGAVNLVVCVEVTASTIQESAEITPIPADPDLPASSVRRARRESRYQEVIALHQQGRSIRAIQKQLQMSRGTIRRFLAAGAFPERAPRSSFTRVLADYLSYLHTRWAEGCHNGLQLWREIVVQGYRGSRALVSRYVARLRQTLPAPPAAAEVSPVAPLTLASPLPLKKPLSTRAAVWLVLHLPEELTPAQLITLDELQTAVGDVATAYPVVQAFRRMLRDRAGASLESWLQLATETGIKELNSFATGLRRDFAAVQNGLSLTWSNGQTEGQVNRLKEIKREMYGRAKFDLLRQRVLCPT